jgi:hypothetical protein
MHSAPTLPRPERTAVKVRSCPLAKSMSLANIYVEHAQSKFICDTQRTVLCWILNGWRLC